MRVVSLDENWAEFIGGVGYTFCRTEFEANSAPESAFIRIVSDPHSYAVDHFPDYGGLESDCWLLAGSQIKYRIFINGAMVGIGPHRPIYEAKPCLQSFDVTSCLRSGRNALGVISLGEKQGFALQLEITYADGSRLKIATDENWKTRSAADYFRPVCWEDVGVDSWWKGFPGPGELPEHLDGRAFPVGWCELGFDDSKWSNAASFGNAFGEYEIPEIPNLTYSRVNPVRITKLGEGWFFFDFGREIVGSLSLRVMPGESHIEVRLGEECAQPDRVKFVMRTMNCYQELWHPGAESMTMEHFGLRAFRYGEVVGWTGELGPDDISALAVHYPFNDSAASFESSNRVLNDVWEFCRYSIKATNMDLYQDCPSRERQCYEGDALITMLCHYACDPDWRLARRSAEYLLRHPTWPAEWRMLLIPIFWADYMQTGDLQPIREHYEELREQFSYHGLLEDGLVREFPKRILVDWPESQRDGYEFGQFNTVANAYVYQDVKLLSQMAAALGLGREADEFRQLASTMQESFNRRLYHRASGLYVDCEGSDHSSLHANLFPLVFGLADASAADKCIAYLSERGMVCSVYSAHFLLDTLFKYGADEAALELLTATEGNSWGHMLYGMGASITTESWDYEQKDNMSWAHPWAAAPVEIIQRRLFGIRPIEPGWKKFSINPRTGGLDWARIVVPTPHGEVRASFEQGEGVLSLSFTVPEGLTAVVNGREYNRDARLDLTNQYRPHR